MASSDRFTFEDSPCNCSRPKGYGQSEKRPGDYRHEGVAQQLLGLLDVIGIDSINLLTHDRGTVQGDWIAATNPDRVLRYCRGEQHLYHFNPILAPQENLFRGGGTHIAKDPVRLVVSGYRWLCVQPGTRQTHQAHHSGIFLSRSRSGGDAGTLTPQHSAKSGSTAASACSMHGLVQS